VSRLHSKSPPTTGTTPCCTGSIGWRNDAEADAGTARRTTKETPCQYNVALLDFTLASVTNVKQVNKSSGNTEEGDAFLQTFLRPVVPRHTPQQLHRQPFIKDDADNEKGDAASNPGNQDSQALLEVEDIINQPARRPQRNVQFQKPERSTLEAAVTRRSNRVTGVRRNNRTHGIASEEEDESPTRSADNQDPDFHLTTTNGRYP
jgi:hypothetical protein